MSRQEILDRFRTQVAQGQPIIGGGAGTGITAKSAEAGGIDLLVAKMGFLVGVGHESLREWCFLSAGEKRAFTRKRHAAGSGLPR